MKWSLEQHYAKEAKRMGNQSRNGRLGAAVSQITKKIKAIKCDGCGAALGYVEIGSPTATSRAPIAWCSKGCIRAEVERRLEQPKAEKCDVDVCTLPMPHTHCNECGATTHGAAYCDNMG